MFDFLDLIEATYWVMEAVVWVRIDKPEREAHERAPRRRLEEWKRRDG